MTTSSSAPSTIRRPTRLELFLLLAFTAIAIGFCTVPIINHFHKVRHGELGTKDYPLWFDSGYRELHGVTPYYEGSFKEYPFMYPPGAAVLLAVGSVGGRVPLMLIQVLINTAAWGLAIVLPVYLLTGKWRPLDVPTDRRAMMFWLPSLVCLFYIWDTYLEGQVAFILSVLLLLMFLCLRKRNSLGAGLSLALAAGLKGFPILALPYLIWRREWKATAYALGFFVLLVLVLPAIFRGPSGAVDDLKAWSINMMAKQTPDVIGQRADRSYTWQNGSLTSVTHRLLRPVIADHDTDLPPIRVNVANLKFETIQKLVNALAVLIGLGYVAVMPWKDSQRNLYTDTIEAAMLLILVILFAPLSFTYNNSWLMLPIVVVVYFLTTRARTRSQAVIATVWLTIALSLLIFTLPKIPAFRVPRAMGNTFFADVLVLIELGWIMWIERKRGAADEYPPAVPRPAGGYSSAAPTG